MSRIINNDDVAGQAADIIIKTLKEEGIDPGKAIHVPLIRDLCQAWSHGDLTEIEFRTACRNLLLLTKGNIY